jgi:DNA-binding response OmpR family regulator
MKVAILVIEDDLDMAQVLQQGLEQENYSVTLAHNGWNGLELAQRGTFAAILLDVMLPALDGCALARQLRSGGIMTPILMVTARDSVSDIVTGLDAGAEDYLTKPFSFLELLARLRSLARRGQPQPRELRVADLAMDTASHDVSRNGQAISLTKTEYLLLESLMKNAGHVVSRDEIVRTVWGTRTAIEQNSIDVYVKALRAKVDSAHSEKLIHTIRGFGYKLSVAG